MDERQLQYISTIATYGSIQKASSALGKNPSTLTRVLRNCELELGTRLFDRTGKGLLLTQEGEAVLGRIREILTGFERLNELPDASIGGVRIDMPHQWTENEVRYLLAVREWGQISKAAVDLYIAQPSLSQTILGLEKDWGQAIFLRTKDGVVETESGRRLLDGLEIIGEQYRQLRADLEEFQQMKRGRITVGIPLNLGTYLLPMIVPEFRERYPGVQVQIRENNSSELERLMIGKKIDFCILHFHKPLEQVQYEAFFDDPFYLVIPEKLKDKFRFPKDRILSKEDLQRIKGTPFVMVDGRQKLRLVVDQILVNARITPDICCTTKSMETAKRLVAAGMGVTFLPRSYLTLYSGVEQLESYQVEEQLNGSWKLVAAYLKGERLSRSSREFLRILKEHLKRAVSEPEESDKLK